MKKAGGLAILIGLCLFAQSNRDAYRGAYRAWRELDPGLERDAASGGTALGQRAESAGAQAAKYAAERTGFLQQLARESETALSPLEHALPADPPSLSVETSERFVAAETAATVHYLEIYAKDTDAGIQQLRQALAQERSALGALSAAIAERKKVADVAQDAAAVAEQARREALDVRRDLVAGLKQAAEQASVEAAAWAEYYRKLAESAKDDAQTPPPGTGDSVRLVNPAPAQITPSPTPIPLARYIGAWTYSPANAMYHGPQPEAVDLVVREENGQARGTLIARFKLPPGGGDAMLRFDFSGAFQNTRNQVFPLATTDGAKGTVELIPGPAFNLLEVNFQTEPKPGKVRQANVILVKR